jgi:hypothetical protein
MIDTGEERKNVGKVRIRHGESVDVGRSAGQQICFGTQRSYPVDKTSSKASEGHDNVNVTT